MMRKAKETGYYGEALAAEELKKSGYSLVKKNFTVRGGEIDLIMEKGEELVFVEVKTRRNEEYGSPLESITPQKQRRIMRAAKIFLCQSQYAERDIRFFAAEIILDAEDKVKKIGIYRDIF